MAEEALDLELEQDQDYEQELEQDLEPEDSESSLGEQEPEYSEVELEAMQQGWKPTGVEGKRALTAEEFLDRKPLYDRMHAQDKRLKDYEKALDAMKKHTEGIAERMYEKALKDLQEKRDSAIEQGDIESVRALDTEMDKIKDERRSTPKEEPQESVYTEADEQYWESWYSKPTNSWMNTPNMVDKITQYTQTYIQAEVSSTGYYPNAEDVVQYLEGRLKREFPEKFMEEKKQRPAQAVERGTRRTAPKPKTKYSLSDLEEQDRSIAKTLIRSGQFTEEEYIKQLEESGYFN